MVEIKSIECNSIDCNSIESIEHNFIETTNLNNQFRLHKISKIEDYFIAETKETELMSKKLSKYISFFDYFDKYLIVLSVTGDSRYIYKNELDKACFQHDMTYGDFKALKKRTAADKFLRDKAFNIAKNPKYDGYQRGLASMVYKFLDYFDKSLIVLSAKKRWCFYCILCNGYCSTDRNNKCNS